MMRFSINRDWVRFGNYAVMIFGHAVIIWSPDTWYLRIGDYFCYSVFAYLVGVGLQETSNVMRYVGSMLVLAVVSQYPFELAGIAISGRLNIMFSLAVSATLVWFARESKSLFPIVLGITGAVFSNMLAVVEGTLIMYGVHTFYQYLPKMKKGSLTINKYWVYSIYPVHLLIYGLLRKVF